MTIRSIKHKGHQLREKHPMQNKNEKQILARFKEWFIMYNIINPPNNNKSLFKIHLWNLVNVHSPSQIRPVISVSSMIHPNQKCPFLTTALPVVSALHAACLSSLILLSSNLPIS